MYLVVEQTANGFSAYIPDLPGCVAAGETIEETVDLLTEAVALHVAALRGERNLSFGFVYGNLYGATGGVATFERKRTTTIALTTYDAGATVFGLSAD